MNIQWKGNNAKVGDYTLSVWKSCQYRHHTWWGWSVSNGIDYFAGCKPKTSREDARIAAENVIKEEIQKP